MKRGPKPLHCLAMICSSYKMFMRSIFVSWPLLLGAGVATAVSEVPPEYLGDYVPRAATCQSALRFRVEADRVELINGARTRRFGNIDLCYSCEGGAKYSGRVVWLMPEFGGTTDAPFTAAFNAGEQIGVVKLEMAPALNAQFPLHRVALKKCPRI